ncbi:hypothetical protein APSETT444_005981 [Aspergillus pseudonomiae]
MSSADERLDAQRHGLITHLLRITEEPRVISAAWTCLSFADLLNTHESIKQRGQSRPNGIMHGLTKTQSSLAGSRRPSKIPRRVDKQEAERPSAIPGPAEGSTSLSHKKSSGRKAAAKKSNSGTA